MNNIIPFELLESSDLIKGAIYKGGLKNNLSSEPISKLVPVGNQSGIRFSGSVLDPKIVVLYTTFKDEDWPDAIIDKRVTYYGDNKTPGREIHASNGNQVLRSVFNRFYLENKYPLILLFSKGYIGYDRIFQGVLMPGFHGLDESEDLVAVWKTKENQRFQNYKAILTLLDSEIIERKQLELLIK